MAFSGVWREYLSGFSADFHISAELFRRWVDGVLKWYWYLSSRQALGHEVFVDSYSIPAEPRNHCSCISHEEIK
jgi:hypothetical protein